MDQHCISSSFDSKLCLSGQKQKTNIRQLFRQFDETQRSMATIDKEPVVENSEGTVTIEWIIQTDK